MNALGADNPEAVKQTFLGAPTGFTAAFSFDTRISGFSEEMVKKYEDYNNQGKWFLAGAMLAFDTKSLFSTKDIKFTFDHNENFRITKDTYQLPYEVRLAMAALNNRIAQLKMEVDRPKLSFVTKHTRRYENKKHDLALLIKAREDIKKQFKNFKTAKEYLHVIDYVMNSVQDSENKLKEKKSRRCVNKTKLLCAELSAKISAKLSNINASTSTAKMLSTFGATSEMNAVAQYVFFQKQFSTMSSEEKNKLISFIENGVSRIGYQEWQEKLSFIFNKRSITDSLSILSELKIKNESDQSSYIDSIKYINETILQYNSRPKGGGERAMFRGELVSLFDSGNKDKLANLELILHAQKFDSLYALYEGLSRSSSSAKSLSLQMGNGVMQYSSYQDKDGKNCSIVRENFRSELTRLYTNDKSIYDKFINLQTSDSLKLLLDSFKRYQNPGPAKLNIISELQNKVSPPNPNFVHTAPFKNF